MSLGGIVITWATNAKETAGDVQKLARSVEKVGRSASGSSGPLGKLGKAASIGIAGAATAAAAGVGIFVKLAEGAIEDAASQDKMAKSLKKSTKATDDQVASLEDWISAQGIAKGVADDKLRPALTRLARSTKNLGKAQDLASLAMDIAAETGKDYGAVAATLAKANDGQIGSLKKLGITLGDQAQNAIDFQKAQGELSKALSDANTALEENGPKSKEYARAQEKVATAHQKVNTIVEQGIDWQGELGKAYQGAADTAAGTIKGTWERIKVIFGELGEAIGGAALPPLQELADWFKDKKNVANVQTWIDKVGEWATTVGTDFAGQVKGFIEYLQSPEGKKALADFSNNLRTIANTFGDIAKAIGAVAKAWDKLPDFLKGNPLTGFDNWLKDHPFPLYKPKPKTYGDNSGEWFPKKNTLPPQQDAARPVVVNQTFNYPKPEKASASAAAAIRAARYVSA